jgi:hypothetical protein
VVYRRPAARAERFGATSTDGPAEDLLTGERVSMALVAGHREPAAAILRAANDPRGELCFLFSRSAPASASSDCW